VIVYPLPMLSENRLKHVCLRSRFTCWLLLFGAFVRALKMVDQEMEDRKCRNGKCGTDLDKEVSK